MADIFISFRTDDTPRVQPFYDAFRARGLSVFWSNDIPKGASRYQAIIIDEIRKASVVVVLWTHASVKSHAVAQECSQATRDNKLFQVVLDEIEPIEFPMEAAFTAQKTVLLGWSGDTHLREWVKLNEAIDARLGRPGAPAAASKEEHYRAEGRIKVDARIVHGAPDGWFKPHNGKTEWFKDIEIGPEMVVVPADKFVMGSERYDNEKPPHTVRIGAPFAVSRFAVTFDEWDATDLPHRPNDESWGRGRRPVINVSWHDAKAYAAWLSRTTGKGYRLLSEAEWEYCCRAGTTTNTAFGDSLHPSQANFLRFDAIKTVEVGTFQANNWGLYDMHGNVWEWVEDNWHANYDGAPQDGSAWGGGSPDRVKRGGSWVAKYDEVVYSVTRIKSPATYRDADIGFRVARTL